MAEESAEANTWSSTMKAAGVKCCNRRRRLVREEALVDEPDPLVLHLEDIADAAADGLLVIRKVGLLLNGGRGKQRF